MITVSLQGGLGNQMFQYALGRHLALKNQTSLILELSFFGLQQGNGMALRHFELPVFNISGRLQDSRSSLLRRGWRKIRVQCGNLRRVRESSFAFAPEMLKLGPRTWLEGFWQSEAYFGEISPVIREDFSFKSEMSGANAEAAIQIRRDNSVSVHIRRGDYLCTSATYADLCQSGYYQKAIDLIAGTVERPVFYIFSDDMPWVKAHLPLPADAVYLHHNRGPDSYLDIQLMSLCKHHIIANSSFSWWGAWLNPSADKIVIGPARWFNDPLLASGDLLPEKWLKI